MTSKAVLYKRAVVLIAAFMAGARFLAVLLLISSAAGEALAQAADPLPSWNEGSAKQAILGFVAAVTREDFAGFCPPRRAHRNLRQ